MSIRGSINEVNIEVKRKSSDPRIEFVDGSRPPRIRRVGYNSYLNGHLYVGDEIIRLNDEEIRSAEDFLSAVTTRTREPARLRIRVRRDSYYRITIRKLEGEQGHEVIDLEIKWRRGGMPLGVSMEDNNGRVTICSIEAGSIADGNFNFGDIITQVNGGQVQTVKGARAAILEAINNNRSLIIRINRPAELDEASNLPADVIMNIRRNMNFHRRGHKYLPAITSAEREATTSSILSRLTGRRNTSSRSHRSSPEVNSARVTIQRPSAGDVRAIPADSSTAELKRTPPRQGSQANE